MKRWLLVCVVIAIVAMSSGCATCGNTIFPGVQAPAAMPGRTAFVNKQPGTSGDCFIFEGSRNLRGSRSIYSIDPETGFERITAYAARFRISGALSRMYPRAHIVDLKPGARYSVLVRSYDPLGNFLGERIRSFRVDPYARARPLRIPGINRNLYFSAVVQLPIISTPEITSRGLWLIN